MNKLIRGFTIGFAVMTFGIAFAPSARAGCVPGLDDGPVPRQNKPSTIPRAGYRPVSQKFGPDESGPTIVGFWTAMFLAKGNPPGGVPDGAQVDSALVQWHEDGTELMNSSRAPLTGSFCMGVWKKTGAFTYRLKHYAKSWSNDGATFVGPALIEEDLTLDRDGSTYHGTFTITQFDNLGHVLPPTPIVGVVTGERITVD